MLMLILSRVAVPKLESEQDHLWQRHLEQVYPSPGENIISDDIPEGGMIEGDGNIQEILVIKYTQATLKWRENCKVFSFCI